MPALHIDTLPLGPLQTNCYLVSRPGSDHVVVIDPGDDVHALANALSGRHVDGVLITHAHFDHILGLPAVAEAPIYVHESDAPAMTDASRNHAYAAIPSIPATCTVQEGDLISLAGIDFTVLHTPGHTLGGVCYLAQDALFTGDTLFAQGYGRTDLYGGNWSQLLASLRRLLALKGNYRIYPGHGPAADLNQLKGNA